MNTNLDGVIALNTQESSLDGSKTVLVLGHARGGTSLIAGVLNSLGVPMGSQSIAPIFEDGLLTRGLRSKRRHVIKQTIESYNKKWPVWGYKQPSVQGYVLSHLKWFHNPFFIFIVKDPASIALRKQALYGYDSIDMMSKVLKDYEKTLKQVRRFKVPTLILSYEKFVAAPEDGIQAIQRFLQLKSAENSEALSFVKAGKKDYQHFFDNQVKRRQSGISGHIDWFKNNTLAGWTFSEEVAEPLTVNVYVNDVVVGETIANLLREDLKLSGKHPTGYCGYSVKLNDDVLLKSGDKLSVLVGDDLVELSCSPRLID